jgi:predicted amidohydrolase
LSGEDFVTRVRELAAHYGVHLICGFVEESDGVLYNAAVVIDAHGDERGRHRKNFLWGDDNAYFAPGDSCAAIDTPLGRLGVIICADGRAPELAAGLVAQGATLIAVPTCWVNVADKPGQFRNAQAEFMLQGRALECGVPFVAANKFGRETGTVSYCGWSVILDAAGNALAQAPPDQAALLVADVQPARAEPVEIPEWAAPRLFASYPPGPPGDGMLDKLRLAVMPAALTAEALSSDADPDWFERLAADGVVTIVTSVDTVDAADQLATYGRTFGVTILAYPDAQRLMVEEFGTFGALSAADVHSFVAARAMALDGAAIFFVMGGDPPLALLRTRAAENRVFVAAAGQDSAVIISPAGAVLDTVGPADARPLVAEINLREAAAKLVYPHTHIWTQRKPAVYAKAFGIEVPFSPLS